MHRVLLLVVLAGCPVQGGECDVDSECGGGEVCARDHVCTDPADVREVTATWTINSEPANAAVCQAHDFEIDFIGRDDNDSLGFSPVPCAIGQFVVDKLPRRFSSVELSDGDGPGFDVAAFDSEGIATLDIEL